MTHAPTYCPNCGAALERIEAAGRERPVCPECGFVYYHNPIPAVGLLIEMDAGLVLVQRGQPPDVGRWALPSGFIEVDEGVEEAAVREAREETGLEVALQNMVGVFSFPDGPPTSGIIVFYRARPTGGALRAGDDAVDVRVFAPEAIPPLPFRTHRQALARWLAERRADQPILHAVQREGYHIRESVPADTARLLELAALIPGKIAPDSDEDLARADLARAVEQRLLESRSLLVYVAECLTPESQVIGFVALSRVATLTGSIGWIDGMAVDPAFRRIGVGAALLEATLRRAAQLGMGELFVNTAQASEIAHAFYRSSGFQEGRITRLRLRS